MSSALQLELVHETPGEKLERQARLLFQSYPTCRFCFREGWKSLIRPWLSDGGDLIWACTACRPATREPRGQKDTRTLSLFGDMELDRCDHEAKAE
jgi:hypothetical protein